jgi:hypothetical protein
MTIQKVLAPTLVPCSGWVDDEFLEFFDFTRVQVDITKVFAGPAALGKATVRVRGADWPLDAAFPYEAKAGPDKMVSGFFEGETVLAALLPSSGPDGALGGSGEFAITSDEQVFRLVGGKLWYGLAKTGSAYGEVVGGEEQLSDWAVEAENGELCVAKPGIGLP